MDWDAVRVFLAVARSKRISSAARLLEVEHTTVSRRLASLEKDVGAPLFHRTVGGYLLTPVGETVLPAAEAMERAALSVDAQVRQATGRVAGRVRLALIPELASHWLVPHLSAFAARCPEIRLQVLVGTRQRDISRGEAELAIQSPRPRQTGLVASRIGRTMFCLYASRAFLAGRNIRIDDARRARSLPLLVYTSHFQMLQDAAWFQPLLAEGRVLMETNSTHALLEAARASLGIAVLPRMIARSEPDLIAVSEAVAELDVWLITHPEFRRDPRVKATADFLKQAASGSLGIC